MRKATRFITKLDLIVSVITIMVFLTLSLLGLYSWPGFVGTFWGVFFILHFKLIYGHVKDEEPAI